MQPNTNNQQAAAGQQPAPEPTATAPAAPAAPAATPSNEQPINVTQWPGAFGIFKTSKEAVMVNISTFVLLFLIVFIAQIIISIFIKSEILVQIISGLLSLILGPAYYIVILRSIAKQKAQLQSSISEGLSFFIQYVLVSIIMGLAITFSALALLIPFFFVLPRIILAPFFLIDQKLSAIDAFKASWAQTKGYSAKVWGIILATYVMILPVFTIIGIPVAFYLVFMYSAASGLLYKFIAKNQSSPQQ